MADNIRPAGVFNTSYEDDLALNRTTGDKFRVYAGFALLLIVPAISSGGLFGSFGLPAQWQSLFMSIAIFVIAAQGLNILVGYTGQISLGHAAFMGVGAYSTALLAKGFEIPGVMVVPALPFFISLPLGALFTGFVGLLFGLPSLRVKGFYLAMATLAAQFIIPWIIENPLKPWTNAPNALQEIPAPSLFGFEFSGQNEWAMYVFVMVMAVMLMLAARNIIRSRTGRAFISIRDNDLAAELLGINVFWYKLQAFFLSAVYAGIAGGLLALERNNLNTSGFRLDASITLLAMLVIGGAGFPLAPLFGVTFVRILQELINQVISPFFNSFLPAILPFIDSTNISASLTPLLFGIALVLFLIIEPRGLAYRWEIMRIAWKIRPYSY